MSFPHLSLHTLLLLLVSLLISVGVQGQSARFTEFAYQGQDPRFDQTIDPARQYLNPVVAGFHPDPSVCSAGDRYYLVNSTFSYFPGIPLFESTDMVSWQQPGHVLTRDSQLSLQGGTVSSGIYAPTISYDEHTGTFYVVAVNVTTYQFLYVKSQDPAQGWSDPISLQVMGMDPSIFIDDDGRAYITYTSMREGGMKYMGDMVIYMNELDLKGDSIVGDRVQMVDGGVWMEGPHIYREGDYYYLMCAEGGTGAGHTEIIYRSTNVRGPWEPCPTNPILAQPAEGEGEFPVNSTGHADIIRTADGSWWAVFLACRPYEGDFYNTGRETFLLPVTWTDGWPRIGEPGQPVPTVVAKAGLDTTVARPTGNFTLTDHFEGPELGMHWSFLRNPERQRYHLDGRGLLIDASPATIYQHESPSAVFYRQSHTCFAASTTLEFTPQAVGQFAGVVLHQDEAHNIVMGKTLDTQGQVVLTLRRSDAEPIVVNSAEALRAVRDHIDVDTLAQTVLTPAEAARPITLRVEGRGRVYSFSYRVGDGSWQTLATDVDATCLSTSRASGFVSAMIGLYASAQ